MVSSLVLIHLKKKPFLYQSANFEDTFRVSMHKKKPNQCHPSCYVSFILCFFWSSGQYLTSVIQCYQVLYSMSQCYSILYSIIQYYPVLPVLSSSIQYRTVLYSIIHYYSISGKCYLCCSVSCVL